MVWVSKEEEEAQQERQLRQRLELLEWDGATPEQDYSTACYMGEWEHAGTRWNAGRHRK